MRTPLARPFGRSSTVGLPAPAASATWSKPSANASASSSVPPKRTPPYSAKRVAPLEQQPDHLEEVLVPAHGDAVLGDAAEARHHAIVERLDQRRDVAHRLERHALARDRDARQRRVERLDLEAVDADHRVAVVQQVVRERESGRAHADDQHPLAGARRAAAAARRLSGFQRVSSE